MNIATAVSQLDANFFDERGLPKIYNHRPAPQIGSMKILKKMPQNDAILISERGEEIQLIEQPKPPNNTPSVSGSVPASDFSQIEFLLMEVVNQSQIDLPSISNTLHLRETGNSSSKATKRTDFQLKSVQNCSSDEEMRETRDLNVSAKPTQSTRDSDTTHSSNNSTIKKSTPGTKADNKEEKIQQSSNNRSVTPFNVQDLIISQDSIQDPIHFIETGFQSKTANSTQRKEEDKKDTAFQLIQKIHNQLQQVQWDLQRLQLMHKYEF